MTVPGQVDIKKALRINYIGVELASRIEDTGLPSDMALECASWIAEKLELDALIQQWRIQNVR